VIDTRPPMCIIIAAIVVMDRAAGTAGKKLVKEAEL
jgi:hypothetical protein